MRCTLTLLLAITCALPAAAYPIDGYERSGIERLLGRARAQEPDSGWRKLPPGALLSVHETDLALDGRNESWDVIGKEKDPELQAALESIFGSRDSSYAVALIDITDPGDIAWAGIREDAVQYPGSVGKVLVMVALFDSLARAFHDPTDRMRILKTHEVPATAWAMGDHHAVPHYNPETGFNDWGQISRGDTFTLAEWVDHMISPSANAGGSTVWKEAMLARHFGADYPVSSAVEQKFWDETSPSKRRELALKVILDPLRDAGLDTGKLRQGTMFTRPGKNRVPGVSSYGSPRELARLLLKLEQGRLVDEWSSQEMKNHLYLTKKRYRYAYPPELHDAAVYFKSGSLYSCRAEEGFQCGKYRGNVKNYMSSIAIVESPARAQEGRRQARYIVALMSNVLRKNSAWDHSRLGAAIEEAVQTRGAVKVEEGGTWAEISDAGAAHDGN